MAPRFVPLNPGAAAPSGSDDLSTILRRLAPLGGLTRGIGNLADSPVLGSLGSGASGLLGLTRGIAGGNPGQAIGGAANLGSSLAGLANMPGVSSALGAVGGPLSFATGLANGDPLGATLGGLQTGSMVSGALGGPTISSGLSSLAGLLGSIGPEAGAATAGGLGAGAGAAGIGGAGLAGTGMAAAAALPFALLIMGGLHSAFGGGGDMFDAMFGNYNPAKEQYDTYKKAVDEFPGLANRRIAGAGLFDQLGDYDTPDEVTSGVHIASSGRSADPDTAAFNISHPGKLLNIKDPTNTDAWTAASPGLTAKNWGSFLNLMDRGEGMGLDPGGMTGDWVADKVNEGGYFKPGENLTGEDYRTRRLLTDEQKRRIWGGGPEYAIWGPDESQLLTPHGTTQEEEDLGHAVSSIGQQLGIDLHRQQPGWDANGLAIIDDYANLDADQLKDYGFQTGQYGPAALNYLRSYDPSVTERPEWAAYASALDPTNALAELDPLTLRPRKKPDNPFPTYSSELNLGGF